ncbi:MAG: hypothetical protein QXK80_02710 [Candidatus Pacearchaeota archaeon]
MKSKILKSLGIATLLFGLYKTTDSKKEQVYYFEIPKQEKITINPISNSVLLGNPEFYSLETLWLLDSLKTLDLSEIFEDDILDKKFIVLGNWKVKIPMMQYINLKPEKVRALNGKKITLEKKLEFLHEKWQEKGSVVFEMIQDTLTTTMENLALINGPFTIKSYLNKTEIHSNYGDFVPIPMKIITPHDTIEIINERNYPPYFISYKLKNKKEINGKDILEIIKAYENQKGDYFNVNDKHLVCSDIISHVIKTLGIDYKKLLKENKLTYEGYFQRNIPSLINLIEKRELNHLVHYFLDNDDKKIFELESWENLKPENFNLESFKVGQLIVFTRYFASGPNKGKCQKRLAHVGIISESEKDIIKRVAMVTSVGKPPYTDNIKMYLGHDFKAWYESRLVYTGSDETKDTLTYRIRKIIEFPELVTELKNK